MFCLGCDYPLDELSGSVCPECGRSFDPAAPWTYRYAPEPIVLSDPVHLARLLVGEAALLHMLLAQRGIPSAFYEERAGVIGYMELPAASIWVERADEQRAREIMRAPRPAAIGTPWTCAACGKRSEGQFSACWHCGGERD